MRMRQPLNNTLTRWPYLGPLALRPENRTGPSPTPQTDRVSVEAAMRDWIHCHLEQAEPMQAQSQAEKVASPRTRWWM